MVGLEQSSICKESEILKPSLDSTIIASAHPCSLPETHQISVCSVFILRRIPRAPFKKLFVST